MKCPYCRREMKPQTNRCPFCGGNLNVKLCPQGHVMDPSWDYCHFCPRPGENVALKERTELESPPAGGKSGTVMEEPYGKKEATVYEPKSAASRLVGWLVSFTWDKAGRDFRLREGKNLIGRDPAVCDIVIPEDTRISNVHAVLICRDDKFKIGDEHSTNGTYVNGKDISDVHLFELQNNDLITVGDTELKLKVL